MRLDNVTDMVAGYTMGMKPDGSELLVVCVKGTFDFPDYGQEPKLSEEQVPLVEADTFTGEPGLSAPLYESDYAYFKPRCDILLNGSAYAPHGSPATKVPVSLQFGSMNKSFLVVGDRFWKNGVMSVKTTRPLPFIKMPITYDRAFGGVDRNHKDEKKHKAVMVNPIGVGFHHHMKKESVDGKPLPNTEELKKTIKKPDGDYRPMSFGPVGRGWQPRSLLAGTYDEAWLDDVFPFLPSNFDEAYFQAAPTDQQVPYPTGGEPVALMNLASQEKYWFPFPKIDAMVWFFRKDGEEAESMAVVDTVIIEPDLKRFTVTCRTALPLKRNMLEMELVVVGNNPEDLERVIPSDEPVFPMIDVEDQTNNDAS